MNDLSRSSRTHSGGRLSWLLPAIIVGIVIGLALKFFAPQLLANTAIVGQIFTGALLIIILPLVASQLALALNNPRERIRRGVSQSKILVQVLISAVVLFAVSLVLAIIFAPAQGGNFLADFFSRFNPGTFASFGTASGIYIVLLFSLLFAAVLGALGEKAQTMVSVCNRISRASIRTFRLVLWVAPVGLIFVVGTFGLSAGTPENASVSPVVLVFTSLAGLLLYATIVLGVDWIVGQLRPPRKEVRSFDRDRRPSRRTGAGPYPASRQTGPAVRSNPRPTTEPRRDRERSPFDMGVSSTPILDVEARGAAGSETQQAPPTDSGRRPDARPRFSRDSQAAAPRDSQREESREARPDGPRPDPRDGQRSGYRGPRPERREGGRDGFRDRGPGGNRGDRPGRDRGPRNYRPDNRETPRPMDTQETVAPTAQSPRPIEPSAISADLARVREQLSQPPHENRPPAPRVEPRVESKVPVPTPERVERPVVREEQSARPETASPAPEVQYGRARHRKGERPDTEPMLPGIEQPPMPEMIDHYSTDDMAFGRTKRKKTVK